MAVAVVFVVKDLRSSVLVDANNSILRAVHSAPRAAHSGAPTLRRYAMTSAFFSSIAFLRGVLPFLQHSE